VEFLPNLNVKPPLNERKAPLLTTFWRGFRFRLIWVEFMMIT